MEDNTTSYEYAVHHSEEEGKKTRKKIWLIFWVLLAITTVEVLLGIYWKDIGVAWGVVKTTFIVLTLAKAYYIVAYYMHMRDERKNFVYTIIIPYVVLALYLVYILLAEGVFLNEVDALMNY